MAAVETMGPTTRPTLYVTELSPTACPSCSRSTRAGISAPMVGMETAYWIPTRAATTITAATVAWPVAASTAITPVAAMARTWLPIRRRRRST